MYDGSKWICARTDMVGRVGRNGVRALSARRSGDGTTPGGIFPLGSMTAPDGQTFQFFGNGANPGVRGTWRQVKVGRLLGGDAEHGGLQHAGHPHGGHLHEPRRVPRQLPELVLAGGDHRRQHGTQPLRRRRRRAGPRRGDLPPPHSYDANGNSKPTSGCVSLGNSDLIYVLQRLVPGQAYFVIR